MKFDMSQFDSYREDNRREVKKAQGGLPTSLWETYSAFANCYGGVIILGVKENKDGSWYMTGLDNAAKLRKDFWDTINNKNKVSVNLLTDNDIEIFEENNGIIMVIHVPKAKREICFVEPSAETGREIIIATAARCLQCSGTSRKKLRI